MSFAVVEIASGEVVHTVPSTKSVRQRERVFGGLKHNLDHERYRVVDLDTLSAQASKAATAAAEPVTRGRLSGLAE